VSNVHLFGVRHHGPGSARSLVRALHALQPDIVLIEGPPDANEIVSLASHAKLEPPVALLIYVPDMPRNAVLYPFAVYSPEWQAIQYALSKNLPVQFIDLPQTVRLSEKPDSEKSADSKVESVGHDPLQSMAQAAGYNDTERWWDRLVESRDGQDVDVFKAVHELMCEIRREVQDDDIVEQRREAHMRKCIRDSISEGHQNIAVVCGAYHTPALATTPPVKQDDALLKNLPKVKTASAWVPWSYERLSYRSGYGAGVDSPVWYELLWNKRSSLGAQWMTRAARLLRDEDIPISSAHVIEACRLADALAAVRDVAVPGLGEYNDAAISVLGAGNALNMQLVMRRWHFDSRLGSVPAEFPAAPLQQDLNQLHKRLRMPANAEEKTYDLDLRQPLDKERSALLRRLRVLDIDWATPVETGNARGTFHEVWNVRWKPEFALSLIEASRYGHTVQQAAAACLVEHAADASMPLAKLVKLLDDALFADIASAVGALISAIESRAALTSDVLQLLDALPSLVGICRYGNVRETDTSLVSAILDSLIPRVLVAIPAAATSIDDDAARLLWTKLKAMNQSLQTLANANHLNAWYEMGKRISDSDVIHSLISGYVNRVLYDSKQVEFAELSRSVSRALSPGNSPSNAAVWIEGLLSGSGSILVHDDELRGLLNDWVGQVNPEHFVQVLPLLRRTFAEFSSAERRQIGERLASSNGGSVETTMQSHEFDAASAKRIIPVLQRIWNIGVQDESGQ
jgi:hypothetical protein